MKTPLKPLFSLLLSLLALTAGCSIQVPVDVEQTVPEFAAKMAAYTKVVVQIPGKTSSKVHTEQGLVAVGIAHTWNVEVARW